MKKRFLIIVSTLLFVPYLYGQNLHGNNSAKLEDKILDTIGKLKEVIKREKYVETHSKGKRHLQITIWDEPSKTTPFYWVKVMEDNGVSYYTHFNFYIYPKTMTIKYLDTIRDTLINLSTWRKNAKK